MQASSQTKFKTVDEYLSVVSPEIKAILEILRNAIKEAAPEAKEVISYNMPAYKLNGVLVYFAVCKGHIGFYPTASPLIVFEEELSAYKTSKGAIQFPLDKDIPVGLVKRIVKHRVAEDNAKLKKR